MRSPCKSLLAVIILFAAVLFAPRVFADTGDIWAVWSNSARSNVLRVDANGNVLPGVTNAYDIGSSSLKFRHGYLGGNLDAAGTATAAGIYSTDEITASSAGKGIRIKEGSNARMGTATLNGSGWVTVSTTAVASTSRVFVSGQTSTGACYVKSRVNGTSFSIYSTDSSDSGTAAWMIVNPAP